MKLITLIFCALLPMSSLAQSTNSICAPQPYITPVGEKNIAVLGEGPHWDGDKEILYYADIWGRAVLAYDPKRKATRKINIMSGGVNRTVTFIIPVRNTENTFIIGKGQDISLLTWRDDDTYDIIDLCKFKPYSEGGLIAPNDAKVDPVGRLWFGTTHINYKIDEGSLYKLTKRGCINVKNEKFTLSNGIAWTKNGKIMFFIDSFTGNIFAYDYDVKRGDVENRRTVFSLTLNGLLVITDDFEAFLDGMTIDSEDILYAPYVGLGCVLKIKPDLDGGPGTILGCLPTLNVAYPTSAAFGGKNLDELYVTTSQWFNRTIQFWGDSDADRGLFAGSLLRVNTEVPGTKMRSVRRKFIPDVINRKIKN